MEILSTIEDLNREFKNLMLSIEENDIKKTLHYQIKVKSILNKLTDEINVSRILSDCFLQLKFAQRYNMYHKDPAGSFINLRFSEA
jgi:hypothetical protein